MHRIFIAFCANITGRTLTDASLGGIAVADDGCRITDKYGERMGGWGRAELTI
jgi:hypothetical protein